MDLVLSCVSYLLVSTSLTIYLFMKKKKKKKEQGENQILLMAPVICSINALCQIFKGYVSLEI